MGKSLIERTRSFKWNSRRELYHYFKDKYDLTEDVVNTTIENMIKKFRPRKHQVIKTQELWEKVGNNLESNRTPINENAKSDQSD